MSKYNSFTGILKLLVFFGLLQLINSNLFNQNLDSPCPNIFQYQTDEAGLLFGILHIESPEEKVIQIDLELSVGNNVNDYKGSIELAYSKNKIIEDIMQRKPIFYKVNFPLWSGLPPKVTKILLNNNIICDGPKIPFNLVHILTTVNLQHKLTISVTPLSSSNTPYDLIPSENVFMDSRFDTSGRKPITPFSSNKNKFNFNPAPPKNGVVPVHQFQFNSKTPTDSTKIISGNTFFNNNGGSTLTTRSPLHNFDMQNIPGSKPLEINPFFNVRKNQPSHHQVEPVVTERTVGTFGSNTLPAVNFPTDIEIDLPPPRGSTLGQRPYSDICGISSATSTLVVNGDSVPLGAYPWLVAIYEVKPTGLKYKCCGLLISTHHVVTAAHCVDTERKRYRPDELFLRLGKLNISDWNLTRDEVMNVPLSVHVHPDYRHGVSDADIAVITLNTIIKFTKFIRPLCLWTGSNDLNSIVGVEGTVVGWGKDENGVQNTAEPKQVTLPIVSQEQCLRSAYQFRDITSNRTFCAGFRDGSGPCNGDSGSGLIVQRNNRWMLRGIVSMSIYDPKIGSCDLNNYVVFADAGKFVNWLLSFIK